MSATRRMERNIHGGALHLKIDFYSIDILVGIHHRYEIIARKREPDRINGLFFGNYTDEELEKWPPMWGEYVTREETIHLDRPAAALLKTYLARRRQLLDEVLHSFPRDLVNILEAYNPLEETLFQVLWEERYTHMVNPDLKRCPKPALPLIKEALK